ncbi:MAG: hypothetical protein KAI02_04745 [Gammaproteobacteria bacterium]|nr:hypothetical protein [Gammaproteobacteria bacterium]
MQFLHYLFGIILAQIAALTLYSLAPDILDTSALVRLVIPLLFISFFIAFWFKSLAGQQSKHTIAKLEKKFSKEREKLRVNAERAKRSVEKEAQKNIVKEASSTHAKANFKVGVAVAGVIGLGGLFVFAQMITAGLLAISAGGGALGGYYWRGKRLKKQEITALNRTEQQGNLVILEKQMSIKDH